MNRSTRIAYGIALATAAWCLGWLLVGAWHSHPNAEDLSLAGDAMNKGIVTAALNNLYFYDGRYFTNILHGLNPLAWGWYEGYRVMPLTGIILLLSALTFFITTITPYSIRQAAAYALVFLMLHLSLSASLQHELYWMVSSIVYLWPWIFTLLWIGAYIRFAEADNELARVGWFLLSSLSLIAAVGMNEMTMVFQTTAVFLAALYSWLYNRELFRRALPLYLIGAACIIFFLTSPGIGDRVDYDREGLWPYPYAEVLAKSVQHNVINLTEQFTNPLLLVGLLVQLALPITFKESSTRLFRRVSGWLLPLGLLGLMYVMSLTYYLPIGHLESYPTRVFSNSNMVLHAGVVICLAAYVRIHWLKRLLIPLLGVCLYIAVMGDTPVNQIRKDYNHGELARFKSMMDVRIQALRKPGTTCYKEVVVEDVQSSVNSIYYPPDVEKNRTAPYWNEAYEEYFKVNEVRVKGDTTKKYRNVPE